MSMAFVVSSEDVSIVALSRLGTPVTDDRAEELYDQLDMEAIEKAALYGVSMADQTEYAYQEIHSQLVDLLKQGE